MNRSISLLFLFAALGASSCQKEKDSKTPGDTTKPTPTTQVPVAKAPTAKVAIASASLLEDCPDPEAEVESSKQAPSPGAPARPMPEAKRAPSAEREMAEGDMDRFSVQPCSQSTMQISITEPGDIAFQFKIETVRVLNASGDSLGTVATRLPTVWNAEGYAAWDEMVAPSKDVQASYKLSMPTWNESTTHRPSSLYGMSFMLEADVSINGVNQTVRSSLVVPEPPDMVET